jgi:hypothetical protein
MSTTVSAVGELVELSSLKYSNYMYALQLHV